jgi:hypothetical protein
MMGFPTNWTELPFQMAQRSMKAYGNAIVPQVALQIFKVIQRIENGETL